MASEHPPTICSVCHGERWVCEKHDTVPRGQCVTDCGCFMPCQKCNPCDYDHPPAAQPGFVALCASDEWLAAQDAVAQEVSH